MALVTFVGCNMNSTTDDCTSILRYSIVAYVTDSVSGKPAAQGATLTAIDGTFADSVVGAFSGPDTASRSDLSLALQRAGTYAVNVRKPGYTIWQRTAIPLRFDRCGMPAPQQVFQVKLMPL